MKKLTRILLLVIVIQVIVVGAALSYLKFALPNIGPALVLTVVNTPERIALWTMYGKMNDEDLKATFGYLKTVPAIKNEVNAGPGK